MGVIRSIGLAAVVAASFGASAAAEIKIGVGGPLTGPHASFGAQLQMGAEMAADDINAAGGINGEQIVLEIGDDASKPEQGVAVANEFIGSGIKFVVGHFTSDVSIPASVVYEENGVLQITPSTGHPLFTRRGLWNTFRTWEVDTLRAARAGNFIARNFADVPIAILHNMQSYSERLAADAAAAMKAAGADEVFSAGVDDANRSSTILDLKSKNVGVVFFDASPTERGRLLTEASQNGLNITVVETGEPDLASMASATEVIRRFRDQGVEPDSLTLSTYAAIQVIAEAIRRVGSTDAPAVASALLSSGPWPTVIGDITFNANGDPQLRPDGAGSSKICARTCPSQCNNVCQKDGSQQCCTVSSKPIGP